MNLVDVENAVLCGSTYPETHPSVRFEVRAASETGASTLLLKQQMSGAAVRHVPLAPRRFGVGRQVYEPTGDLPAATKIELRFRCHCRLYGTLHTYRHAAHCTLPIPGPTSELNGAACVTVVGLPMMFSPVGG